MKDSKTLNFCQLLQDYLLQYIASSWDKLSLIRLVETFCHSLNATALGSLQAIMWTAMGVSWRHSLSLEDAHLLVACTLSHKPRRSSTEWNRLVWTSLQLRTVHIWDFYMQITTLSLYNTIYTPSHCMCCGPCVLLYYCLQWNSIYNYIRTWLCTERSRYKQVTASLLVCYTVCLSVCLSVCPQSMLNAVTLPPRTSKLS